MLTPPGEGWLGILDGMAAKPGLDETVKDQWKPVLLDEISRGYLD